MLDGKIDSVNNTIETIGEELSNCHNQSKEISVKYVSQLNKSNKLSAQVKEGHRLANYKSDQLMIKLNKAKNDLDRVQSTLSFKMGACIINSFKTWKGTLLLPFNIIKTKLEWNNSRPLNKTKKPTQYSDPKATHTDNSKKDFKKNIACIMDEFTFSCFSPEANFLQLTPKNWVAELQDFSADMLFIESAWRGKDNLWGNKVGHGSKEIQQILQWCQSRDIPTIFWNKEDPVHFATFLNTAKLFDIVFTTDIDCIGKYKASLGHDNVYLLPFAAQPKIHNPIEIYNRRNAFCFAGAYYSKYPDRTNDLEGFVENLSKIKNFDIFDRNFNNKDPNYMFPDKYSKYIIGSLPHSEIDKAYKGYDYAINLNSVKQSQTMFARRVFELLASNTFTISNFSKGIRLLFGDLVVSSDNPEEVLSIIKSKESNKNDLLKLKLLSLRKVLKDHTYEDRLAYIISKVKNKPIPELLPSVAVISECSDNISIEKQIKLFNSQSYSNKNLYIIARDNYTKKTGSNINIINSKLISGKLVTDLITEDWISISNPEDYYGNNYLLDLCLSTRYSDCKLIGKSSKQPYTEVDSLPISSSIISRDLLSNTLMLDILSTQREDFRHSGLNIDPFNYNKNGQRNLVEAKFFSDDLVGINTGIDFSYLLNKSENITKSKVKVIDNNNNITTSDLYAYFGNITSKNILINIADDGLMIESDLKDGEHQYIYSKRDINVDECATDDVLKLFVETTPGLNIQIVSLYLNDKSEKISHTISNSNKNISIDLPDGTKKIRFGIRVYSNGICTIKDFLFCHRPPVNPIIYDKKDSLILTNYYPSYENIYRNGFVYSRAQDYAKNNISSNIYCLNSDDNLKYYEFKNTDVITGNKVALRKMLDNSSFNKILVHFLDADMWDILKDYVDKIDIIVWIHGSEVQPWHRRDFNYKTEDERDNAKAVSYTRTKFWQNLFSHLPERLHFVFVSKYFSEEVMEDVGINIPVNKYSIIHNPINTDIFNFIEKDINQRKSILSIRPFASAKYANDLSVKTILELSKKPWFDELNFKIIGDGLMFDEILEPLIGFDNVSIERRFLPQSEIATLHKDYGVFLTPTRMDSQGVSRDEAMSSGLVPVTNAVTAIPEFVDSSCGILAEGEDWEGMAEGIERIYKNPELFAKLSGNAAKRVRTQTSSEHTTMKEIDLINNDSQDLI